MDYFHRLPAVVALTRPTSQASVLTAIVDAVVSAIVLRKAWPNGLRAEWADVDLTTRDSLIPALRDQILSEAVRAA